MRPIDLPTNETLEFILAHTPAPRARILEVGCGAGELAFRLQAVGHHIIAIDTSAEAVRAARQLGIDARIAEWPHFAESPFDLVLFTHSLHHIHALTQAVEQAARLLRPSGLVIVEDFAFDEATSATIAWLYGILSLLNSCRQLQLTKDSFGKTLLLGGGHVELWQRNHAHDLNSAATMATALKEQFTPIIETAAPYVYRYLCPLLADNDDGYAIASQALEMEKSLAKVGAINLIGRRFVGRKE